MGGIANQICGVRLSIAVVVLLAAGTAVQAQDLSVSPTGWDFGSVAVGTSETVTFNLLAGPPSPVWTYQVVLNETQDFDPPCANPYAWPEEDRTYSLGAFSFGAFTFPDAPGIPREMSVGELVTVPVIFTPPSPGYYSVYLGVHSNDSILPPGTEAFFLLTGRGVSATIPVPGALLLTAVGTGLVGMVRRRLV